MNITTKMIVQISFFSGIKRDDKIVVIFLALPDEVQDCSYFNVRKIARSCQLRVTRVINAF